MKKGFKFLGVALAFLTGAFLGQIATGDQMVSYAVGTVLAVAHIASWFVQLPFGALFSSIDISALATALGAYHREHRDELVTEMLLDEAFTDDLEVLDDVTDELPLPNLSLTDLTKP